MAMHPPSRPVSPSAGVSSLTRRGVLAAGAAVIAVGAVAERGWVSGSFGGLEDGPAFQPWADWRTGAWQGPLALVAAGILAANPHNSQPWRFRVEPGRVTLRADSRRGLGAIDPFRREMHLGLGCALENMMVAARDGGIDSTLELFPGGAADPDLVASLTLTAGKVPKEVDPHWLAIGTRHTNRGAYDPGKLVAPEVMATLEALVDDPMTTVLLFPAASERGRAFAAATVDATARIIADDAMHQASFAWFRQSLAAVREHRDGISLATSGASEVLTRLAIALPDLGSGRFGEGWLTATRDVQCPSAALFGLVAVRVPRDPGQVLRAGRLWQRLHLEGEIQGLAMQPLNQTLEIADRDRQLNRPPEMASRLAALVGDPGWTPVFGFRAGTALTKARASARRSVAMVLDGEGGATVGRGGG